MSYQEKYLKYKNKYLALKNQLGGDECSVCHNDTKNPIEGKCAQCVAKTAAVAGVAPAGVAPADANPATAVSPYTPKRFTDYTSGRAYDDLVLSFLPKQVAEPLRLVNKPIQKAVDKHYWPITTGEFILSVGSKGSDHDQYNNPHGMCSAILNDDPVLLICDYINNRVVVADAKDGKFIRALQFPAGTPSPIAVAFIPMTRQVLVLNDKIEVFAGVNDDTVVRTIGYDGGPQQFYRPCGVAVLDGDVTDAAAPDGPVAVVADTSNHRLSIWRVRDGTLVRHVGSRGQAPGQFNYPTAVTVVPAHAMGNDEAWLVVADSKNRRVQVLTREGTVIRVLQDDAVIKLGSWMSSVTVCIGTREVLVTDFNNHRIVSWRLLDGDGLRVVCGVEGSGPGQFFNPTGLVAFDDGTLWVADGYNHRLCLFR